MSSSKGCSFSLLRRSKMEVEAQARSQLACPVLRGAGRQAVTGGIYAAAAHQSKGNQAFSSPPQPPDEAPGPSFNLLSYSMTPKPQSWIHCPSVLMSLLSLSSPFQAVALSLSPSTPHLILIWSRILESWAHSKMKNVHFTFLKIMVIYSTTIFLWFMHGIISFSTWQAKFPKLKVRESGSNLNQKINKTINYNLLYKIPSTDGLICIQPKKMN